MFHKIEGMAGAILLSCISAGLLALASPGFFGLWPLLFVALAPLLQATLRLSPVRAALAGLSGGVLYYMLLLYWVLIVLGQYGGLPFWLSWPALCLLAAYMACYQALFCFLLSFLAGRYWHKERSIVLLVWAAPILWVGLDYLRGKLFSGFPWMDLGYSLYLQPQLIQAADIGGHHLVTFGIVLFNSMLVGMVDRQNRGVRWNVRRDRHFLFVACAVIVFIFGYSLVRYKIVLPSSARSLQAHVAVTQGNINQSVKWSPEMKEETVGKYISLSRRARAGADVELVVWPETALPFYPQQDPLIGKVVNFVQSENVWLLTGAPLYSMKQYGENALPLFFNGAILFNPAGAVAGQYAKQHLVPFGEYVPMQKWLPFLAPLVVNVGDFTPGTSKDPLSMGALKLGPLICYESIFSDISRESVNRGANLLVNMTNDAWYGQSSAPYQSLAMAVFRAVETKRSLVRAANTGISGFVDPVGRILLQTSLFTEASRSASVPLMHHQTVFCRQGYLFAPLCCYLSVLLLIFRRRLEE